MISLSLKSTPSTKLDTPTLNFVVWITSAEKVFPDPTWPYTDRISEMPYEVTFLQILLIVSLPSKIKDSYIENSPIVWYRTIEELLLTEFFKNPVAPLLFPLTKVGVLNVIASFRVISVVVWISYKDIFHSLRLG